MQLRLPAPDRGSLYVSFFLLGCCARQLLWPHRAELTLPSAKEVFEALSALVHI